MCLLRQPLQAGNTTIQVRIFAGMTAAIDKWLLLTAPTKGGLQTGGMEWLRAQAKAPDGVSGKPPSSPKKNSR